MAKSLDDIHKIMAAQEPGDFWVRHALNVIKSTYGDVCEVKHKNLLKYGSSAVIGTTEATVAQMGSGVTRETYETANNIDSIICTDDSFTGNVYVEGHYFDGSNLVFHTQTVAATGQTRKALTQSLARATRGYIDSSQSLGTPATDLIYVYDDTNGDNESGVPTTAADIKLIINGVENQSQKCATSLSYQDYCLVSALYAGIAKKSGASATLRIRARTGTKVFRTIGPKLHLDADGTSKLVAEFRPLLIIPKNSDIEVTAEGNTSAITVSAGFNSLLAKVVS